MGSKFTDLLQGKLVEIRATRPSTVLEGAVISIKFRGIISSIEGTLVYLSNAEKSEKGEAYAKTRDRVINLGAPTFSEMEVLN